LFCGCWQSGKEINEPIRAIIEGGGPDLVRIEINGQQRQAVISGSTSLQYLKTALQGVKKAVTGKGSCSCERRSKRLAPGRLKRLAPEVVHRL
jgi:hypothetical protein